MTDMLIHLIVAIISQCICAPKYQAVLLKYMRILFANCTSIKLKQRRWESEKTKQKILFVQWMITHLYPLLGFPRGSSIKESTCNAGDPGDLGLIPGSRRSPGGGNGNPLQFSCLGNLMDRGAWRAKVHVSQRVGQDGNNWSCIHAYQRDRYVSSIVINIPFWILICIWIIFVIPIQITFLELILPGSHAE